MGIFLILVGFAVNAVCGVIILIKAFQKSVGWGLAVFFIPFAGLFFVLNHWEETKKPFLAGLAATTVMFFGLMLGVSSGRSGANDAIAEQDSAPMPVVEEGETRPVQEASIAAKPVLSYDPPRSTYVPSYNPSPDPAPAPAVTDTKTTEDEWTRKPQFEQVYVDRDTDQFYSEKCRKRPENVYRIPRSVALMQGMTEAKCR